MDVNSQHQIWSFWQYRVYEATCPSFALVKQNCARFGRAVFGAASAMRIVCATDGDGRRYWEITVRSEGHPAHDPQYTAWMHAQWRRFLRQGFGPQSEIRAQARLEAGDRQNGRPPDQLIILPTIREEENRGECALSEIQTGAAQ